MKYYAGVLVGLIVAIGTVAILLSRYEAASERHGAAMLVDHYRSEDGLLEGRLYYLRTDVDRHCFAIWEDSRGVSMVPMSCEEILWK